MSFTCCTKNYWISIIIGKPLQKYFRCLDGNLRSWLTIIMIRCEIGEGLERDTRSGNDRRHEATNNDDTLLSTTSVTRVLGDDTRSICLYVM